MTPADYNGLLLFCVKSGIFEAKKKYPKEWSSRPSLGPEVLHWSATLSPPFRILFSYIYIYIMILLGKTRKNILKSGSPSNIIFLIYQVGIKKKEKGGNVVIRKADLKMPILWNCPKEKPTHKTVFLRMVTVNNKKKNQKWLNCSATEQELSKYTGISWRYCRFNSRPT